MRTIALGVLVGVIFFRVMPEVPSLPWLLLLPIAIIGLFHHYTRLLASVSLGFLVAATTAHITLSAELSPEHEHKDILVTGKIIDIPQQTNTGIRVELDLKSLGEELQASNMRVRLRWDNAPPDLKAGDQWQLKVRLRRPRSTQNPGAFDFEAWLFKNQIRAQGYVLQEANDNQLLHRPVLSLQRWRQSISFSMEQHLDHSPYRGMLTALAIGDRQGIDSQQWEILRRTGTNHLMAISGLHIGMVTSLVFILGVFVWSRIPNASLLIPARKIAALIALLAAFCYAALAGFSIPTQRAFIMAAVALGYILSQKKTNVSIVLAVTLLLVIMLDPLAVDSISFVLSFAAVATIVYASNGRLGATPKWKQYLRVQWIVTIGLLPMLMAYFGGFSIVSPIANAIAVIWVSLSIVPFVLLAVLFDFIHWGLADAILQVAEISMAALWSILAALSRFEFGYWQQSPPPTITVLAAVVGALLILAPRGLPGRYLGLIWLLPLLIYRPLSPNHGELWFTMLDVGQGLAVVAQTKNHVLIFDSGPKYSANLNAGDTVVVPFLRFRGIAKIDSLVISSRSKYHVGGIAALLQKLPVAKIMSNESLLLGDKIIQPCIAFTSWQWDGVTFKVLHPTIEEIWRDQSTSCVLQIEAANQRILLTGDIDQATEAKIVHSMGDQLRSQVLVVPKHGSDASSSAAFIRTVDPKIALIPVGDSQTPSYPDEAVVGRYQALGVLVLDSSVHGAISLVLGRQGLLPTPTSYRIDHRRYWRDP